MTARSRTHSDGPRICLVDEKMTKQSLHARESDAVTLRGKGASELRPSAAVVIDGNGPGPLPHLMAFKQVSLSG